MSAYSNVQSRKVIENKSRWNFALGITRELIEKARLMGIVRKVVLFI
jgi:hypothetical protein